MDQLAKVIADIALMLKDQATTLGPDAVRLTLEVARLHAAQSLVNSLLLCVLGCGLFGLAYKGLCIYRSAKGKTSIDRVDTEFGGGLLLAASGAFGTVFTCIGVTGLVHIPAWVGLFKPEVWLAFQIVGKLGK